MKHAEYCDNCCDAQAVTNYKGDNLCDDCLEQFQEEEVPKNLLEFYVPENKRECFCCSKVGCKKHDTP